MKWNGRTPTSGPRSPRASRTSPPGGAWTGRRRSIRSSESSTGSPTPAESRREWGDTMGRYVLSHAAHRDLREIVAYVRARSIANAKKVNAKLRDAIRMLSASPGAGHERVECGDPSI